METLKSKEFLPRRAALMVVVTAASRVRWGSKNAVNVNTIPSEPT